MIKIELFAPTSTNIQHLEERLADIGIHSLSATEMKIYTKNSKTKELYRGVERASRHPHKLKIEIVTPKEHRLQLFRILKDSLTDDQENDTRIFTTPLWQTRTVSGNFHH